MDGKVVVLKENPEGRQTTPCKGAKRNFQPGQEISYMTLREGGVYIFSRERKR